MTWAVEQGLDCFTTFQVHMRGLHGRFVKNELLLEDRADVSIVHPDLLRDLLQAVVPMKEPVHITGVGGLQFTVHEEGYLQDFLRCMSVRIHKKTF